MRKSILLGLALFGTACASDPIDVGFRAARLAVIPEGTRTHWIQFTPDGRVAGYIDRKKDDNRIVLNGETRIRLPFI